MKILLLEDDLILTAEVKKFLESYDFQCTTVYDGGLFLEEIQKNAYDFYLLDVNVPKVNGLQVCDEIRKNDKDTPIMFLSAYGEISFKKEGYARLADDYLVKPFQFDELLMKINSFL